MPISVYRLGEMPIQSCGQSVSAPRRKAGVRFNAHTELRAKRQRSAREAIYRNRLVRLRCKSHERILSHAPIWVRVLVRSTTTLARPRFRLQNKTTYKTRCGHRQSRQESSSDLGWIVCSERPCRTALQLDRAKLARFLTTVENLYEVGPAVYCYTCRP
jgi:hypothetical protein